MDTWYTFEHRASGERLTIDGQDPFPLIDATRKLRELAGYPDDWDVVSDWPESRYLRTMRGDYS